MQEGCVSGVIEVCERGDSLSYKAGTPTQYLTDGLSRASHEAGTAVEYLADVLCACWRGVQACVRVLEGCACVCV